MINHLVKWAIRRGVTIAADAVENQYVGMVERREARREANDPVYRAMKEAIRFAEAEAKAKKERREARLQRSRMLFYVLWVGCGIAVASTAAYPLTQTWLIYVWLSLTAFGFCSWTMNPEDISTRLQRICWLSWIISVLCFCTLILAAMGTSSDHTVVHYIVAGWLAGGALWIAVWQIGERYGY